MSSVREIETPSRVGRDVRGPASGLLVGGALFFVGGSMHPSGEDVPGAGVKEALRSMFVDPAWDRSHGLILLGMVVIAAVLVALVRSSALSSDSRAQKVGVIAAVCAVLGAVDAVPHLFAASEADAIAAGDSTPITNVHVVLQTVIVPAFGFSMAGLAVIGAQTRTLGNWVTAVPGVVGGVAYGIAGATVLFIDGVAVLFAGAAGLAVWVFAAGVGLLVRSRTARPAARAS